MVMLQIDTTRLPTVWGLHVNTIKWACSHSPNYGRIQSLFTHGYGLMFARRAGKGLYLVLFHGNEVTIFNHFITDPLTGL